MNQILITEKLYITPELKRKKKVYKFNFLLSIFLVVILISFYIYAEYDRNKSEEVSLGIMSDFNNEVQEDTTIAKNNVLIVVLDETTNTQENNTNQPIVDSNTQTNNERQKQQSVANNRRTVQTTSEGYRYETIATISIPKINLQYPILDGETDSEAETEALLKISPTKFWGSNPNEVGNFCIVGHNYRNNKFFSKVPTLENGDIIEITDIEGRTLRYSIYNKYEVVPEDLSCTSQLTNGKKEITVITCTNDSKMRVIVKARAV